MQLRKILACALLSIPVYASAQTLDGLQSLTQQEFRLLAEDLGSALTYHQQTPTEPLGVVGFDVGVAISFAQIRNTTVMEKATSDSVPTYVPVPTLRVDKGLPFGFDVGLMYATVPGSNVDLWGAQARWAILQGGVAVPAVGLRASYSQVRGVDQLDLTTKSLDASISKGFAMLTPYAGVGHVWINAEPHAGTLTKEAFGLNRFFVGAGFKLALFNMNAELDKVGPAATASLKAGIRF